MITIKELRNVENDILKTYLNPFTYPYEVLANLSTDILKIGKKLSSEYEEIKENVWVHKTVKIGQGVEIIGPAIIMENSVLKHNAFIRENVIIGNNCVIGNSSEIKNSILVAHSNLPHFNYVGDSIIGNHVNLGAGSVISNLRFDKKNVKVEEIETPLRKIGAFIGDNVEIGVNSVICPGTVVMPNACIYPLTMVKGVVLEKQIIKSSKAFVERL